ncbi:MAG TPA: peptidoglycan-associated lipoprotein Pal [Casimicrobiaceae bacterium]|nr:peptidoglycan-associated lipoprotein Pal [Casimicrobiaceae bacterium]
MNKILIGVLAALALAACSTTPKQEGGAPVDERNPTATTPGAATSGAATGSVAGAANQGAGQMNPLKDPSSILSKRSVYFDFDAYAIKDDYKSLLEAHARYLQANRNARMTIEGNTDERGSREYNIALGQRRADAAKRMMLLSGATEAQIDTVSFGKEKPRNPGHDESAWAENRRDDLGYRGE